MREGACMNLKKIPGTFSICKVTDYSQVSPDAVYCFTGQTEEENLWSVSRNMCLRTQRSGRMVGKRFGFREFWIFH